MDKELLMTPADFNKKPTEGKATVLWDNGVYAGERVVYNKYLVKIYSLLDFWVEVYYDIKDNRLEDIYALETEEDFNGILNSIDLVELFSK